MMSKSTTILTAVAMTVGAALGLLYPMELMRGDTAINGTKCETGDCDTCHVKSGDGTLCRAKKCSGDATDFKSCVDGGASDHCDSSGQEELPAECTGCMGWVCGDCDDSDCDCQDTGGSAQFRKYNACS